MKPDYKKKLVEETGQRYNEIIFEQDYIPKEVYIHQINLRNNIINQSLSTKKFEYAVDLGCGTGFHLKTLSKYATTLIACDRSFGALKESKKRVKCEYIVCDINKLPFKPNTIDFIWIAGVLHHVPDDLEQVIGNNISPVLKKKGFY
jgi:ubiquinone/menaquinone biosynthesis C-methylase UbiE